MSKDGTWKGWAGEYVTAICERVRESLKIRGSLKVAGLMGNARFSSLWGAMREKYKRCCKGAWS